MSIVGVYSDLRSAGAAPWSSTTIGTVPAEAQHEKTLAGGTKSGRKACVCVGAGSRGSPLLAYFPDGTDPRDLQAVFSTVPLRGKERFTRVSRGDQFGRDSL